MATDLLETPTRKLQHPFVIIRFNGRDTGMDNADHYLSEPLGSIGRKLVCENFLKAGLNATGET
jgi:hypothetical protein